MGFLLCCFDGPDDDIHLDSNDHEEIQGLNAANELRAPLDFGLITCDDRIETVATTELREQKDFVNQSQVEAEPQPEPVLESKAFYKSMLCDDYVLSRDDECAICLEGYDSENPRITTKCTHHWHLGCILEWQNISELCPNCAVVMEFEEME